MPKKGRNNQGSFAIEKPDMSMFSNEAEPMRLHINLINMTSGHLKWWSVYYLMSSFLDMNYLDLPFSDSSSFCAVLREIAVETQTPQLLDVPNSWFLYIHYFVNRHFCCLSTLLIVMSYSPITTILHVEFHCFCTLNYILF
ncbi:unnamed protein product [Linum tenue]|uniref:Uncharacterized protein n=1 Tax=Linum tenue TaxID=586396 RepID=A0AAV0HBI8_9ROSI|nr:unnamed protein product [Linum tenue]